VIQLPARIGKYELEEFLGGGMSHVYRARDTVLGRTVAVKVLTEQAGQETRARFLQEARMAGNLAHDNVMAIYDFGQDEAGNPFMVMEFLRGEDLRHAIDGKRTGDLARKLQIAMQTARSLEYIHTQRIVHRDIKPENIHISANGAVKLMDFGIAKTEDFNLTQAGFVLGTPYYMAPEQVMGKQPTPQMDVYAFGVLLFELISGVKPITGDTVERLFYSILNEPIKLEPLAEAGAPPAVIDLVARCTAKDPAQRPQGFAPICAELERLARPAAPPPAPVQKGLPQWLIPAVGLLLALLGAAAWYALRPSVPALPATISTPTGEMVLVPAGSFLSGEKKESVSLPAFYIDRTEVTNAAYRRFAEATGQPLPAEFDREHPEYPVVRVSIMEAQSFARWAGKRLPTGREWEKAARGADGRLFPWGNQHEESRANLGSQGLRPVTEFPNGASPFGALQMVGNAWEFVDQLSTPGPRALEYFAKTLDPPPGPAEPWYAIRGEGFNVKLDAGAVWDSTTVPARWRDANIGFRCAKDP